MIVGIDLGTTNSAIGVWRNGAVELIPNALGSLITPSVVSVGDDGEYLVGLAARERQVTHPALTASVFKRYMGTARETRLGNREPLRPEDLSALVLRSLKADAEAFLGEPVTEAIITVPAYFNDKQRKATRRAGQLAGLQVERLLNEPTAAALAHGIHELANESRFLVFDLGGGTFDVSVLEIFEGIIEVRATTGDNRLGGEDFNDLLIEEFFRTHPEVLDRRRKADPLLLERVRQQAERARRALTTGPKATMAVAWQDQTHTHDIEAEQFEKLCAPLIARLRDPVLRALRDGQIDAATLKDIVLVGGATRMPVVRRAVARMFGRFPTSLPNPDEAIAIGAAIQAGLKARDASLRDVVMTDVCPYSLGVDMAERRADGSIREGVFAPIIERNTVIPASRVKSFTPVSDQQRFVEFVVYQGESRNVADNVELGKIRVPVPAGRASEVSVEVRFSYDVNGLFEVDVAVPETGEARQLVIVDAENDVSAEELERRRRELAALKVLPRNLEANRAALARGARCYEESLGERRVLVGQLIAGFESALDSQDPRTVEEARTAFLARLDQIDGETWL
jgi:molecular chaperone HscC